MLDIINAIILGIMQGLTEFLPVSSTAHLIIAGKALNAGPILDSLTFDAALHMGTLFAVLAYFYKDWIGLFLKKRRLLLLLILATIPAAVAGFFLESYVETAFRSGIIIALSLILFSFVMILAEKVNKTKALESLTPKSAIITGLFQALALIPGVSRSGATMSGAMFFGIKREDAAKFSFLLSTPIIGGAVLLSLAKAIKENNSSEIGILIIGIIASAVSGFLAIKFAMKFFEKYSLNSFAYYRIALGIVILLALAVGML